MNNTEKEQKILLAIINYITSHGYSPTVREIGDAVGLRSTSSAHKYVSHMLAIGMLETDTECSPRAIWVPGYRFIKEVEHENP